MNGRASYTRTAVALHWLVALAIIGLFPVGLYMSGLPLSPLKLKLYAWHKWAGMTIFALAIVRVLWRLTHRPPPLPESIPRWQRLFSGGVHALLYVLIIAVPLSGWLMTSALGVPVVYFRLVRLPDLVAKNKELGDALKWLHGALNYTMAALVAAHVAAAIKHHWVDRDEVLTRMIPFLKRP